MPECRGDHSWGAWLAQPGAHVTLGLGVQSLSPMPAREITKKQVGGGRPVSSLLRVSVGSPSLLPVPECPSPCLTSSFCSSLHAASLTPWLQGKNIVRPMQLFDGVTQLPRRVGPLSWWNPPPSLPGSVLVLTLPWGLWGLQ